MKISAGNLILYDTASFITLSGEETRIEFDYGGDSIVFILNFITDESKKLELTFEKIDEKTLRANLINWDSPFGTTIIKPIDGTISNDNRKFYIQFSIRKVGEEGSMREVIVSFYLEKEAHDDNN